MKKITLSLLNLLTFGSLVFGQTYSTGTINLSSTAGLEYTAQIDVTSTEVTLTLLGPSDRWLALGFDTSNMFSQTDVVIFDGTNLTDRTFTGGRAIPSLDSNQDWAISSNNIASGTRTLVATRALDTGEANDYIFEAAPGSINLVWARGNGATFTLGYHGGSNKGATASGITLGTEDFKLANNFKIIPNPASSKIDIKLSNAFETGKIKVYDAVGKQIHDKTISNFDTFIDVSNWNNGIYLISVEIENILQTKRFIKF
jgi:hypothetical protein